MISWKSPAIPVPGGHAQPPEDVNANGSPLLGDSRDLFRPKTWVTFLPSPASISGAMATGR